MAIYNLDVINTRTITLIADSTDYFFVSLYDPENNMPINLSNVVNIEWFIGSASIRNEFAEIYKSYKSGQIKILDIDTDGVKNTIEMILLADDTKRLQGLYNHQLMVTDSAGKRFRVSQGKLDFYAALFNS